MVTRAGGVLETNFRGENAGAGLRHDVHAHSWRGGRPPSSAEQKQGAETGWPGQPQFFLRGGEDAKACQEESSVGFLHRSGFARRFISGRCGLHFVVGEPSPSVKRQRVASKALGGDDVKTSSVSQRVMFHGCVAPVAVFPRLSRG